MAPEQALGRADLVDRGSDVYRLGAILYEVLTGGPHFRGAGALEVLRRVVHEPPVPPRQVVPASPAALEAVCLKALSPYSFRNKAMSPQFSPAIFGGRRKAASTHWSVPTLATWAGSRMSTSRFPSRSTPLAVVESTYSCELNEHITREREHPGSLA
jgi:hypothetical protein